MGKGVKRGKKKTLDENLGKTTLLLAVTKPDWVKKKPPAVAFLILSANPTAHCKKQLATIENEIAVEVPGLKR